MGLQSGGVKRMGLGVVLRPRVKVSSLSATGNIESYPNLNNRAAFYVISAGADTDLLSFQKNSFS